MPVVGALNLQLGELDREYFQSFDPFPRVFAVDPAALCMDCRPGVIRIDVVSEQVTRVVHDQTCPAHRVQDAATREELSQ